MVSETPRDGRRVRGDATRHRVARKAAEIATTHGLDSISLGTLSVMTGVSKSGILTVFGTREAIQVAAVAEARQIYRQAVIERAGPTPHGVPRLRALLDAWLEYRRARVFPGGCFVAATTAEYGSRSGAVADAVRALKRDWLQLLESELTHAGSPTPTEGAFKIDAFLVAANTRCELFGDESALELARSLALETITAGSCAENL